MEKSILWSSTSKSSLNEDNTFCLTSLTNDQIEAETLWIISSDCRSWPPLYSDSDCGARDCNGEEIDTVLAIESSELRSWCETRVWSLGLWRCRCCCCCRFCSVCCCFSLSKTNDFSNSFWIIVSNCCNMFNGFVSPLHSLDGLPLSSLFGSCWSAPDDDRLLARIVSIAWSRGLEFVLCLFVLVLLAAPLISWYYVFWSTSRSLFNSPSCVCSFLFTLCIWSFICTIAISLRASIRNCSSMLMRRSRSSSGSSKSQLEIGDFLSCDVVEGVSSSDSDSNGKVVLLDSTEDLLPGCNCGVRLPLYWFCSKFLAPSGDTANTFNPFDLGVTFPFGVFDLCSSSLMLFGDAENCRTLNCKGIFGLFDLRLCFPALLVGDGVLCCGPALVLYPSSLYVSTVILTFPMASIMDTVKSQCVSLAHFRVYSAVGALVLCKVWPWYVCLSITFGISQKGLFLQEIFFSFLSILPGRGVECLDRNRPENSY